MQDPHLSHRSAYKTFEELDILFRENLGHNKISQHFHITLILSYRVSEINIFILFWTMVGWHLNFLWDFIVPVEEKSQGIVSFVVHMSGTTGLMILQNLALNWFGGLG